jgi:high-affinity Fe2+/Pb2+ permease
MSEGFWPALLIVAVVVAWVLSKVWYYLKKSEQQWQQVDKSKLKIWDDDEE